MNHVRLVRLAVDFFLLSFWPVGFFFADFVSAEACFGCDFDRVVDFLVEELLFDATCFFAFVDFLPAAFCLSWDFACSVDPAKIASHPWEYFFVDPVWTV